METHQATVHRHTLAEPKKSSPLCVAINWPALHYGYRGRLIRRVTALMGTLQKLTSVWWNFWLVRNEVYINVMFQETAGLVLMGWAQLQLLCSMTVLFALRCAVESLTRLKPHNEGAPEVQLQSENVSKNKQERFCYFLIQFIDFGKRCKCKTKQHESYVKCLSFKSKVTWVCNFSSLHQGTTTLLIQQ